MIRFLPCATLSRTRYATLGGSVMLLAVLGGCAQISNTPTVEEASFNQSSMASGIYHVQRGDTLYSIGWKTGIDFRRLASLNNLTPPYNIEPGQALRLNDSVSVPGGTTGNTAAASSGTHAIALGSGNVGADSSDDSWLVPDSNAIERNRGANTGSAGSSSQLSRDAIGAASGVAGAGAAAASGKAAGSSASTAQSAQKSTDTPPKTSNSASTSTDNGGTAVAGKTGSQDRSDRTYTPTDNIKWQWPTEGKIVGDFGDKTNLTAGIDIGGQKGQPVKAAGPGIVVYAGNGVRGYGNLIILKHNDHFLSAYAHNDTLNVEENDVVRQGETIATMGSTDADSVKLHFEIRQDGQPKDPLNYLPGR